MKEVAIIGGGFSGSLTAIQLLRNSKDISVKLINCENPSPQGIAFSTERTEHLLNVPAGRMSAFPDKPSHFIEWLISKKEFEQYITPSIASECIPRFIYGIYLKEIFQNFISHKQLTIINQKAVNILRSGSKFIVHLNNDTSLTASHIVLAMGNYLPADPKIPNHSFFKSQRYFQNPWDQTYLKRAGKMKNVLIIGTGLTMVDCVLSLNRDGFNGKIVAVSPRGYSPASHAETSAYPDFYPEIEKLSLKEIVAVTRKHLKIAASQNILWNAVIDSIRPHVQKIWQNFSAKDKKQFVHHLRHIWGVARHRLPVAVYKELENLSDTGKLEIIGGRIKNIEETKTGVVASVQLRKTTDINRINADIVINCTGPQINYFELEDELVINLLSHKLIMADELKMGVSALSNGKVLKNINEVSPDIYAIGSLLRGVLWETTAVPEIRVQAKNIAEQIIKSA